MQYATNCMARSSGNFSSFHNVLFCCEFEFGVPLHWSLNEKNCDRIRGQITCLVIHAAIAKRRHNEKIEAQRYWGP